MKQFMVSKFDEYEGIYHIWFGNRICVKFASKRNMAAFLADTNRFLTQSMVELNEFYISLFKEYRGMWFCMMNVKNGVYVNLSSEERTLQKLIIDIMDQFNRCGNSEFANNSGTWSFIHLQNISFMTAECINILIEINKKRNNTYAYHSLEILKNRVLKLQNSICNYPEVLPVNAIEMKSNK